MKRVHDGPVGTAVPAVRGRLGEASLPNRKWLGHAVPPWIDHGIFFITINCQHRGCDALMASGVIACIRDAAMHYQGARWWIHPWLIMPDHIHALLSFPPQEGMVQVVADWKRFVARKTGIEWQKGFFDHRLRHDDSFVEKAHYIRMNTVRKGLVALPEDWPHVLSFDGRVGSPSRPRLDHDDSVGTAVPAVRGRLGEASLPVVRDADGDGTVGTAVPAVRGRARDGRLGEASLPEARP